MNITLYREGSGVVGTYKDVKKYRFDGGAIHIQESEKPLKVVVRKDWDTALVEEQGR